MRDATLPTGLIAVVVVTFAVMGSALEAPDGAEAVQSGTFTIPNPVIANLEKCLKGTNETMRLVECYENSVVHMNENHTWWSSLSLLYLRADLVQQARSAMNRSVMLWIDKVRPDMEKKGIDMFNGTTRWVDVLRFAYDDESKDETARRSEAVEMGLLLAKKFELDHLPGDAHMIYYEFLLQTGNGAQQLMDFHRRTGNMVAMLFGGGKRNKTSILHDIADAMIPIVDGFSQHLGQRGPGPFEPIRRMCGVEFTDNKDILVKDIVKRVDGCVRRLANLTDHLNNETDDLATMWTGSMRETPYHRLAVAGATDTLETFLEAREGKHLPADRFGRGILHQAAAWGWKDLIKMGIDHGGDVDNEDKGKLTPRVLGCASPGFLKEFEKMLGVGECTGYERRQTYDEDIPVTDDSGTDGGWNPKTKRPKYLHCDIDVRDASQMTQSDLMIAYTHVNHPVVLRNSFYEEDDETPNPLWRKKNFNKTFGNVLLRHEFFPRQEHWGLRMGSTNVSTVSEFLDKLDQDDKTIGTVNVDHTNHPLNDIADKWVPPTFYNKKKANEVDFYDPTVTVPTVHVSKKGSRGHHHVRAQMAYHAVVYGHQEWSMLPPRHARSMRDVLPSELSPLAQRCDLYTGDVLLLPDLWSASWVSKANGVSMERYVYKKN